MSESLIFLIESGKALKLVKKHIADVQRVRRQSIGLVKELDPQAQFRVCNDTGVVIQVLFSGKRHPDFTVPGKYGSWPRKGTFWDSKFREQVGHENGSNVISEAFGVPLSISYGKKGKSHGSSLLGHPRSMCGFLYLSGKGPYALYVPDVEAEVASYIGNGYTVEEPANSFKPVFEGCRRIEQEEWDILVAQHKLKEKRAAQKA